MELVLFKGEELPVNYPTEKILLSLIDKKDEYDYVCFNFSTLVRNFLTALSFDSETMKDKSKKKYQILKTGNVLNKHYKMFKTDLEIINNILNDNGIDVTYYYNDYKKLKKCLPNYKRDEEFTLAQQLTEKYVKSFNLSVVDEEVLKIETMCNLDKNKSYVVCTNNTVDLLEFENLKNINLVESFTGEFKPKTKWYTKYKKIGNKDMSIFPFNSFLLTVLGCGTYINSSNIKIKRRLYELALNKKWNVNTSITKIRNDLSKMEPELFNMLKEAEKCYKKI